MLSVSSMALATMLGSACGTNMANLNNCNAALYNNNDCAQVIRFDNNYQDMDGILSQMGVSVQSDAARCGVNPGCTGGNCQTSTCQDGSCSTGACANGFSSGYGF